MSALARTRGARLLAAARAAPAASALERAQRFAGDTYGADGELEDVPSSRRGGNKRGEPGWNLLELVRRLPDYGKGSRVAQASDHAQTYYEISRVKPSPHDPSHGKVWGVKYHRGVAEPNERPRPIRQVLRRPWVVREMAQPAVAEGEDAPKPWIDMREKYDIKAETARRSAAAAMAAREEGAEEASEEDGEATKEEAE